MLEDQGVFTPYFHNLVNKFFENLDLNIYDGDVMFTPFEGHKIMQSIIAGAPVIAAVIMEDGRAHTIVIVGTTTIMKNGKLEPAYIYMDPSDGTLKTGIGFNIQAAASISDSMYPYP